MEELSEHAQRLFFFPAINLPKENFIQGKQALYRVKKWRLFLC